MPPKLRSIKATTVNALPLPENKENNIITKVAERIANNQIAELQEQVRNLTLENQSLRQELGKYTKRESLAPDTIPKRRPLGPMMTPNKTSNKDRGCACTGTCASKKCGCVKKDAVCGASCKCTDACTNKERTQVDTDPMKPTKQLARSPLGQLKQSPGPTHNPSNVTLNSTVPHDDVPLPVVKMENQNREEGPPKEIFEPEVDWAQHNAQLVKCSKCQRSFYPYRLKTHEKVCKKI